MGKYRDKLNVGNKHAEEWFEQFDLHLNVERIVVPVPLAETEAANDINARAAEILTAETTRTAHFLTSVTSDMYVLIK